ncbi:MAG: MATE family efflux transporter, partial [Clostridia bacterium]|nr:MATE family efflux transporter [Clostridia bacterium]
MAKREVNMLSGPIMKGLLAISLPIMVMHVLQTLFNMADMTVLQMFDEGDGYAVGAVGVCGTPTALITGILIGIASGANVVIARYIGSRDKEKLSRAIGTATVFSVLGGLILAIVGFFLAEQILSLVNCPPELLSQAKLYFRIYFAGAPILMLYNFSAAILRAAGDTRRPMIYIIIGGIANVVFNCIFVGIFDLSVAGVAIATVISWIISATLCIITLSKDGCTVKIERAYLRIYLNELKEILYIGVPTGLQSCFYSIANMMISGSVNTFGPDATTGVSIANQFDAMTYHVVMAPSYALMPYVSQNLGSRNVKRAKKAVVRGVLLALIMGAVFGWLIVIFSRPLASIMTDSPSVIA